MMYVDRYWHGAAAVCLSNFAEGDSGRGVGAGEVSRMRDGGEVEPGKDRITDQIGRRIAFDIIPLTAPIKFDSRLSHEFLNSRTKLIMSQANGAICTSDSTAAIDLFVAPDSVV